jgi:hypothetical protein
LYLVVLEKSARDFAGNESAPRCLRKYRLRGVVNPPLVVLEKSAHRFAVKDDRNPYFLQRALHPITAALNGEVSPRVR